MSNLFDLLWEEFRDAEVGGTMTKDRLLRSEQRQLRREAAEAIRRAESRRGELADHEKAHGRLA